jgi:uridine kinase
VRPADPQNEIHDAPLRPTVQILLPDGRVLEGPRGSALAAFLVRPGLTKAPVVGAVVNGELRELTYPITVESRVRPVTMDETDGMRIYRRSLTFLLATAFEELFPDAVLTVDHSVYSGGYFCQVSGRKLDREELRILEARMRELVRQDLPFAKSEVKTADALTYFRDKGYHDKERLLAHRRKPTIAMYSLGGMRDYHHGYMVPSTGYVRWFGLHPSDDGFTLLFPQQREPTGMPASPRYAKLLTAFRLYGDWLDRLGIAGVGALNDAICAGRGREIVLVAEALQEAQIAAIARQIAERRQAARVILIAGPSCSGKTTFSKRLSIQLLAQGISTLPVELDSFFVDREKTPRDETGEYDYEALEALDLPRLNHDLRALAAGETVLLPRYDFKAGRQLDGATAQLGPGQVLVLEGIHGLNPALLPDLAAEQTLRIYASALTQLNLDRYNRVSTTDTRLIRRIVRDAAQRGYTAAETIRRWESVRRGEKRHIFPYQENADVMFNSALVYEGSALALLAEPLLRQVTFGTPEHVEAKRLLRLLEWFESIDPGLIPDNSILREFLGGSILSEFTPWQPSGGL